MLDITVAHICASLCYHVLPETFRITIAGYCALNEWITISWDSQSDREIYIQMLLLDEHSEHVFFVDLIKKKTLIKKSLKFTFDL